MGRSGGHAFAIVGYSKIGFLVRNSRGSFWGLSGYSWLTYCDAQINLTDVWVVSDSIEFKKFDIKINPLIYILNFNRLK